MMPDRTLKRAVSFILGLAVLAGPAAAADLEWPGFRGPEASGSVRGRLVEGDRAGLTLGWKRELGSGYSSVVVGDGRVITMFADGDHDVLAAFSEETGDELWRYQIGETYAGHSGSHDGPISTPLLAGDRVFGLAAHGQIFAVKAETGEPVWTKHAVEDFGGKAPYYGYTASPVYSGGVVVMLLGAPEGKAIVGLDPLNGNTKWSIGEDGVEYQSPIATRIHDRELVLAPTNTKLFGIDAASGKELWSYEHGGDSSAMGGLSMVPVPAGEGRLFLMNQRESSTMLKLKPSQEVNYEVEVLWSDRSISRSYVTPVYRDGHLYGISGRVLTCVDAATGEIKWRSREPGDAFLTMVGDKLVAMTKPGSLHVASVTPEGYNELASIKLFDDHSWSEAAIAGRHIYARSMGHLARIDVTSTGTAMGRSDAWLQDTAFGRFLARVESASDKKGVIDAYMAGQKRFPIIEGSDLVHFVYRGEAEDVGIVGDMIGFRREDPMQRIPGTDLFYYSMRLEPNAAVAYGFIKDYADEAMADPLNAEAADGLFGEVSFLAMPAWEPPAHIAEAARKQRGTLEMVEWEREVTTEGEDGEEKKEMEKRTAQVYLPAGFNRKSDHRYPTVYIHNGKSALEEGHMQHALDNLIGTRIEPVIAVFVMPREGQEGDDIGRGGAQNKMVVEELVPLIDKKYPTIADARARATVGAGRGGTVALTGALSHSDVFGRAGSFGAVLFGINIGEMLAGLEQKPPLAFFMQWGTYDLRSPHEAWDMAADNRKAWEAIRSSGYRPAGGEVPEGVTWKAWRSHTDEMLTALFPLQNPA